jgi:hypothetical protein
VSTQATLCLTNGPPHPLSSLFSLICANRGGPHCRRPDPLRPHPRSCLRYVSRTSCSLSMRPPSDSNLFISLASLPPSPQTSPTRNPTLPPTPLPTPMPVVPFTGTWYCQFPRETRSNEAYTLLNCRVTCDTSGFLKNPICCLESEAGAVCNAIEFNSAQNAGVRCDPTTEPGC